MKAQLRAPSPTGHGTKDWLIQETGSGIQVSWGPTGNINQSKTYPARRFVAGVYAEIIRQVQGKLGKGYQYVGAIPPGLPAGPVWGSSTTGTPPPQVRAATRRPDLRNPLPPMASQPTGTPTAAPSSGTAGCVIVVGDDAFSF
jgi:hypothetical protein